MSLGNLAKETLALLRKDTTTAGITTATGLNFYYLEPQAKNLYPVFYPILASTARVNPMFNGMKVGGTACNWKAIVGIDSGGYPALSEGNRNAYMNITTRNYASTFKFLGKDGDTSWASQASSRGFDDAVQLTQFSLLNALLNDEERMMLYGNSGPSSVGGNGYALGTTNTPVAALAAGTGIPTATNVSAYCVALTPWGVTLATLTGVKLPFTRTNADGSTDTINGGTAIVSAASNVVATTGGNLNVKLTVAATVGAVGYAWYVNSTDASSPTKANSFFHSVTAAPTVTISALPSNTNQAASAASLTTDNSYNLLDFDGIMTWHFGTSGSSQPAYLKDLGGAGFTSNGDGTIKEFEDAADYLWNNYKVSPDKIYLGGNLAQPVSKAILTANGGPGAQRIMFDTGNPTGGSLVAAYRWKYSYTGEAKVVPVVTHPWLPAGTVLFDITTNPYPAAGNAIPSVRRMVTLEDHFSLKWPYRKLVHEVGTYMFGTMEHYLPFSGAVLSGCGSTVQ